MADDKRAVMSAPNPWDYRAQIVGEIGGWQPPLVSADRDVMPGFELTKARGRDLQLTDPFVANSGEVLRDAVVGRQFSLALTPAYKLLGASIEEAEEWQQIAEADWSMYADGPTFDADATRKSTWTFLMHQVELGLHVDGEALGIVRAKEGAYGYLTCLQLIEPERLDRRQDQQRRLSNGNEIRFGVERDEYGEPIAYHIMDAHPTDVRWTGPGQQDKTRRIERYVDGRAQVLHVFDEMRPQMTRGASVAMLTSIKRSKMLSTYSEAELSRQIQSASYAAVIETELPYEQAMKVAGATGFEHENGLTAAAIAHLRAIAPYHHDLGMRYNGSRVLHLLPNEKLKIVNGQLQGGQLEMFERTFLRQLAAGLNVSYEELSRDFSGLTYASGRLSMELIWRRYYRLRAMLVAKLCMPFVAAWMEEAVKTKRIPMLGKEKPTDEGWRRARHAMCIGDFVSWGAPIIDPVKEYTGKGLALSYGFTTLRDEVAAEGGDYLANLEQRSRETKTRERLGLNPGGIDPTLSPGGKAAGNQKSGNPQEGRKARKDGPG